MRGEKYEKGIQTNKSKINWQRHSQKKKNTNKNTINACSTQHTIKKFNQKTEQHDWDGSQLPLDWFNFTFRES